jgi:hypothetical protein
VSLSLLAAASAVVGSGDEPAESVTVTIPGCVVQPADILGWWRGEDDLLAEVGPDLSGSTGFENGVIRRGMTFDGTGTAAVDGFPAVSTGVTVEAWIRPVVTGQIQSLFSRWTWVGGENDDAFALFIGPNSDLFWTTDEITTRAPESLSVPVPQLFDGWYHHVAATWDATTMTIYLDGLPVGSKRSQGGVLNAAPTTQFRVGSSSGPGAPFTYQGGIDEPTVYGRALTAAEIDGIVAAGPKAKCAEDPPAVATAYVAGPGPVAAETPADAGGVDPVLTPDGRHVVFRTRSTDVVPVVTDPATQTPGQDYDMFSPDQDDLVLVDTRGTPDPADDARELLSVDSNELGGGLGSSQAAVTPTASHVAFASISNDLVPGDTLPGTDVFLRNRLDGTTSRVSVRSDGSQPAFVSPGNNNQAGSPSLNDAGTVIAFTSTMRTLAPEANPVPGDTWQTSDVYVRDVSAVDPANWTTTRITVGLGNQKADGSSVKPIVSPDGRYVWFTSAASNLVTGDTNGRADLFVHDRQTSTTTRVNTTAGTGQPLDGDIALADVSPNGRWITFSTNASTVVLGDTNNQTDVFVLDTVTGFVNRVSINPGVAQGNGPSFAASVSDNGRYVVFQSQATNLVADDTNAPQKGGTDVFVSDTWQENMVTRISRTPAGGQRTGQSSAPVASSNASTVLYVYQDVSESFFGVWRVTLAEP